MIMFEIKQKTLDFVKKLSIIDNRNQEIYIFTDFDAESKFC